MILNTDWLSYKASENGDKTALLSGKSILSYNELNRTVNSAALYLSREGLKEKQIVPVLSGHNAEFVISVFALWRLGCIPVPLSPHLTENEIDLNFSTIKPSHYIKDESVSYKNNNIKSIYPGYSDKQVNSAEINWSPDANREAVIIFTSGTSGKPKGVVISFNSLYHSFCSVNNFDKYTKEDRFLASLPFYHIGGFSIITRFLLSGAQIVIPEKNDFAGLKKAMFDYNPTIISTVPTNLHRLLSDNIKPNSSLRSLYIGGGPSSRSLIEQAVKMNYPVIKVYGSTETCAMISAVRVKKKSEYSSSGRPLKDNKILIDSNNPLKHDDQQTGEILVLSKSLFDKYYDDSLLTKNKIKDGIYHSGDYGYFDSEGLLHVVMRRSDIIVSGGENIIPAEVENVLLKIDGIDDCFVAGIDNDEWGQIAVAFITSNQKIKLDNIGIKTELVQKLARYKIPKKFIWVDQIPRDKLGKVIREKLLAKVTPD